MEQYDFPRKLAAEFLGTAFLLATVVGSGIMGETLAGGNVAIALLGNTLATGAILAVLILIFGPISGAHFNPAVTLSFTLQRTMAWSEATAYVGVQVVGGLVGVVLAHVMFGEPLLSASVNERAGLPQWTAEFVAKYDQDAMRADFETAPLAVFEPMVRRVFSRPGHMTQPD